MSRCGHGVLDGEYCESCIRMFRDETAMLRSKCDKLMRFAAILSRANGPVWANLPPSAFDTWRDEIRPMLVEAGIVEGGK